MRTLTEIKKDLLDSIRETLGRNPKAMVGYAVGYLEYWDEWMDDKESHVQILYIQNNLSSWRHPKAKELRTELKEYDKQLQVT